MADTTPADFTIRLVSPDEDVTDNETAHVRNIVAGMLAQLIEGQLPLGFNLSVEIEGEAASQHAYTGSATKAPKDVDVPVDRFGAVKTDVCSTCVDEGRGAREIVDQGDGRWYHTEPCGDPDPGGDPLATIRSQVSALHLEDGDVVVVSGVSSGIEAVFADVAALVAPHQVLALSSGQTIEGLHRDFIARLACNAGVTPDDLAVAGT